MKWLRELIYGPDEPLEPVPVRSRHYSKTWDEMTENERICARWLHDDAVPEWARTPEPTREDYRKAGFVYRNLLCESEDGTVFTY